MMLHLFNSESKKKEEISKKEIKLYTCGPTVYDYAHIGNFRTYIFEDLLKRTLLLLGYKVEHVMNITDVDDKTIKGAIEQKLPIKEYTEPFTRAFFEDLKSLRIIPADHFPKATDYIEKMIIMIQKLLDKKIAYHAEDGSIYFSIKKFPSYGKLSHLKLDELKQGAGERNDDEYDKENAADFVLWKSYDEKRDGNVYWDSPFGKGRPGWHIECSCMAISLLGDEIDIHCGGVDNIFPHHENEIAQSESLTDKKFSKYWAHSEHLLVDGKKMSKSLGNFYTLRDLLQKGYDALEIRYLLLSSHYRMQLNFTLQGLDAAKASLMRIHEFIERLVDADGKEDTQIIQRLDEAYKIFTEALSDDLNISEALAALFDLIRDANRLIDQNLVSKKSALKVLDLFEKINSVLDIMPSKDEAYPEELIDALVQRDRARKEKNWKEADRLRELIEQKGFIIVDTPKGAKLKKK